MVKFSNQSKMYWVCDNHSKFIGSIWVHHIAFWWLQLQGIVSFHRMFIFKEICWVLFSLWSNYCGKIFISIQAVLNVWEQFKVQNPEIFALKWTSAAYNFFIQGSFSIIFVEKVAHTSLVFVVKISYQSKKFWVNEKHFSKGRISYRCELLLLFSLFFDISKQFFKHNESIEWFFSHQSLCVLVLNHFAN